MGVIMEAVDSAEMILNSAARWQKVTIDADSMPALQSIVEEL